MTESSNRFYHVTTLSNFARGFDKYRRCYRKRNIVESTYPNEFYVLPKCDLHFGVSKAAKLLAKLNLQDDRLVAIETDLNGELLRRNPRNGIGLVWPDPNLPVTGVYHVGSTGTLAEPMGIEDALGKSLALHARTFATYNSLRPRSISFLPVARGCQASCPFCFSEASASVDQAQEKFDEALAGKWVTLARLRGAERAVVTGGGEPLLMRFYSVLTLIRLCRTSFDKTVLITNGMGIACSDQATARAKLQGLHEAGLSILAISRHHQDDETNSRLMRVRTRSEELLRLMQRDFKAQSSPRPRLVCVLQRGGIETIADIDAYVRWAIDLSVEEICFKELYVSSTAESVYHSHESNLWSARHQIPLSVVHDWADKNNFRVAFELPWGAPVFSGLYDGKPIRIAAYTEPSLFWERSHGIARSWNVMANGKCLVSLEDRRSVVELPQ